MTTARTIALVWWAPTLALVLAGRLTFWAGYGYRVARARRLMEAGNLAEADRVIERLKQEVEAHRARAK